ncbi:MAG TPA: hypothetical protein VGM73_08065 [Candidatus Didemnitutus sp.]|jgi:hypothetical protein
MNGLPADSRRGPLRLVVAGVVASLLVVGWRSFCTLQQIQWNAPRLTPCFALARGLTIYGTREHGPYLGWTYGPVSPLFLLPAAWAPNLTLAYAVAFALNVAAFLLPAWFAIALALPPGRARGLALLFWCSLALSGEMTLLPLAFLHVDLLCLGWLIGSVALLVRGLRSGNPLPWILLAALTTALAIWTKQSAVAAPAALTLALWFEGRKREAVWLLLGAAAWTALLGLVFVSWFGAEPLAFNLIEFHRHNPWRDDWAAFFLALPRSTVGWLAAGVAIFWLRSRAARERIVWSDVERLLLWLAVGCAPLGLIAAMKVAGGWNSLHSLSLGVLVLAIFLGRVVSAAWNDASRRRPVLLALAGPAVAALLAATVADLRWTPSTVQSDDLAYARLHPGRLYLPWNPLLTLITDGRIYPFDDALLCLARAGLEAPRASVQKDIPHGALVVYPDPVQSQFALRYLAPEAKAAQP